MVTIPTIAEIKADILADIESSDTTSSLLPVSVWDILATAMAGAQYLLYKMGLWLYNQIFTLTMDEDALTNRAAEFGIVQTPAVIWQGTGTATGTDGTIIAAGKICTIDSLAYEVTAPATISGGSIAVTLQSLEAGDIVNRNNLDELTWSTPQIGLDSICTIASTTQTGEDEESFTDFKTRILNRQRNKPQGGAIPDFNQWATEVAGIAENFTFRPAPGFVNCFPLTDDDDPANRIPSGAKLTEVADYINDDTRYPFGRPAIVIAFTELNFDVDFTNLTPDNATVRASIETATENYIYARRPQQFEDEPNPINLISAGEITAEAVAAGAINITVTLKNAGGGDITDTGYELDDSELSVPRTLSWV